MNQQFAPQVVSIANACLGGLHGRSALLIGHEEQRYPYALLLHSAGIQSIYQEESSQNISTLLPSVHLLMNLPSASQTVPMITAASIASGCVGRRKPLLLFDLAETTSIDELAGLLPAVCLYTPSDLRRILEQAKVKIF